MTQPDHRRSAARTLARFFVWAFVLGVGAGAVTWAFLGMVHLLVDLIWKDLPEAFPSVSAGAVRGGAALLVTVGIGLFLALAGRRPFDVGHAERTYDTEGRIDPRPVPLGIVHSLLSLTSGAAVGPEAPLTDITGGIGTWFAERIGTDARMVRTLTYASVAGAFGAFLGVPPVGALLAMELLASGEMTIDKPSLVGGLVSASSAWVTYSLLEGHAVEPVLAFPAYDVTRLIDLGHAVWLGALGGAIGLTHLLLFKRMRLLLRPIRKRRPWAAAGLGALALVPVAVFVPRLLFSGEDEVGGLVADAAELGIGVLLALAVGKLLFSAWSLSTAYFGGPLFPMIYGGTAIGLAIHLLVPDVPEAVAVMAMIAGVVSAAAPAPFSITVFLGLLSSITLVPPIAIAAASAYVVRSLVVPTDLGEYRMIAAEERRQGD